MPCHVSVSKEPPWAWHRPINTKHTMLCPCCSFHQDTMAAIPIGQPPVCGGILSNASFGPGERCAHLTKWYCDGPSVNSAYYQYLVQGQYKGSIYIYILPLLLPYIYKGSKRSWPRAQELHRPRGCDQFHQHGPEAEPFA